MLLQAVIISAIYVFVNLGHLQLELFLRVRLKHPCMSDSLWSGCN